jgi:hypothetical protein
MTHEIRELTDGELENAAGGVDAGPLHVEVHNGALYVIVAGVGWVGVNAAGGVGAGLNGVGSVGTHPK